MVDFTKLVKEKRSTNFRDLHALFESLDRHTSHIELRPVQIETLNHLSKRREERDLILKISTGAGKTTIALLYLLSFMEELSEPVLYLCPTKQLTKQVANEADKLGIKTEFYPAGETYPPIEGIRGKSIIICTYDKLFNAKSTFNRSDVLLRPSTIVLDDAHAGVEEIRGNFTLSIGDHELRTKLLTLLQDSCYSYNSHYWNDILDGDPKRMMEIPHWIWKSLLPSIEKVVSEYKNDESFMFVIPNIIDVLRWCRCVVSGNGIEIIPYILPLHISEAYNNAKHRLFMSATLADDSVLIRELGCDFNAAKNPVIPLKDKGLGERMVLAPSLVDMGLNREWVMQLCSNISKKFNVIVLAPSKRKAIEWEPYGANVFIGDQVEGAIESLRTQNRSLKFAVFIQRYDGVDLPDNSCRVLVLDSLPIGEGLIDKHDSTLDAIPGGTRNRLIYRIEQGMGRAVRSHADFAVILLSDPSIAHFIAKHDVLSNMNPDTKAQLQMALDLAKLASEENSDSPDSAVVDMIKKCLFRNEGWKQFYQETMRNIDKAKFGITETKRLNMANADRSAFENVLSGSYEKAVSILRSAIDENILRDELATGWYLQAVANYLFEIDPAQGYQVQCSAHEKNRNVFRPADSIKKPKNPINFDVQSLILDQKRQFENPNGIFAKIQDLRSRLSFSLPAETVEQAICDLAEMLGAIGGRPEKEFGEGPDDLWLWPNLSLVIEAKTGNNNSLHKSDAGQLALSLNWFEKAYPTRGDAIPVVIAKVKNSDRKSGFPPNTRIVLPENMTNLLQNMERFYRTLVGDPLFYNTPREVITLQSGFSLLPEQFITTYTIKVIELK